MLVIDDRKLGKEVFVEGNLNSRSKGNEGNESGTGSFFRHVGSQRFYLRETISLETSALRREVVLGEVLTKKIFQRLLLS